MRARAALGIVAVLAVTACSGALEGEDDPGAVVLRRNIPTPVGDCRVAAANLDGDTADLSIEEADSTPARWQPVATDDRVSVCGSELTVRTIDDGYDNGEAPDGAVVLVPG